MNTFRILFLYSLDKINKMKNKFTVLFLLSIFSCFGFVSAQIPKQQNQINPAFLQYQKVGGLLPAINVQTIDFKTITNTQLKGSGNLIVVIFNPSCGSCDVVAGMFAKNTSKMKNTKILFMTQPTNSIQDVMNYARKCGLKSSSHYFIGVDKIYTIDKLANYGHMPLVNVYDRNHKLLKTFNGNVTMNDLKKYIK